MSNYDEHEDVNKGGRPTTVLDDDQLEQVEKLASMLSTEQLADFLGIGRTTFYEVMKRQPEVSERYKRGRAKVIGNVAKNLIQKATSGDNQAMIFYLKTQAGWKETTHVQQEVKEVKSFEDMYDDV